MYIRETIILTEAKEKAKVNKRIMKFLIIVNQPTNK